MNILITAGPTREYLDPVRYLSNDSSGRMGFALAEAAHQLKANVTLIAGPVALATPHGIDRIDVVSCEQMRKNVIRHARTADVIIMAAAVADARPKRRSRTKLKKPLKPIALAATPDILAKLGALKRDDQLLVGFALETGKLITQARNKLNNKRCDWIVANRHTAIGAAETSATLIPARGKTIRLPRLPKHDLAMLILSHVLGS